ncbi:hypothetical protein GIB67_008025 [Kingdonia uniflora]|uniref:DUF4283 domain-containing protein n=1 Tax=Kingdonia uniflora TaxID=39325 RepID=A0A7J7KV27_9MAGN|nr:hypothetical protein GIB67_008025 [Kingdonia uniflora]
MARPTTVILYCNGELKDEGNVVEYLGGCTKSLLVPKSIKFADFSVKVGELCMLSSSSMYKIKNRLRFDEHNVAALDVYDDASLELAMNSQAPSSSVVVFYIVRSNIMPPDFHAKTPPITLIIPRKTSNKVDISVSNGGSMHLGNDYVSRTINEQTGSIFDTNPLNTVIIPRETSTQAYDSASNGGVVHLGTDDVSRMTNGETSSQADDQVPNDCAMHLGVHDVSRAIDRKTTSQFHTSLLSTVTIPRNIGSQTDYHVSNGCAIKMGIDDISRTINVQSGSGFHTNLRNTFTIPRETSTPINHCVSNRGAVQATYDASRTMNGQTCSRFHTNSQFSSLTIPRKTSTQEDYHVSNGGPMYFGVDDVSRTINRQTGSAFHTYSRSTLTIPRETSTQGDYQVSVGGATHMDTDDGSRTINAQTCSALHTYPHSTITIPIPRETCTQADDGGVMHLAIDNVFRTINEITGSGVYANPHCTFTNPRDISTQADDSVSNSGAAQLGTDDASRAANAKIGIESDSQTSARPQLAREISNYHKPEFNLDEGRVVVRCPKEVIEEGIELWKDTIVGVFVGTSLPFSMVRDNIKAIWGIKETLTITMKNSVHHFTFGDHKEREMVLDDGPWHVADRYLYVQKWKPFESITSTSFEKIPIWVKFRNLPRHCWTHKALGYIASAIGFPLCMVIATENGSSLNSIRVCVEISHGSYLPSSVLVDREMEN